MDLSSIPKDTCPLCRQVALDRSGAVWQCRSCGCKLEFDPRTQRSRVAHFPDEYAAFEGVVGSAWLTRSQMFERAEMAYRAQDGAAQTPTPRWLGPAVMATLALGVTCIILAAIAAALVLSPSLARTRRAISAAYQATPPFGETSPAMAALGDPVLESTLDSPLLTPTPEDQPAMDDLIEATASSPGHDDDSQGSMPVEPTVPVDTPPQNIVVPPPVSAPGLPPTDPQALPPTFTPLPPVEPTAPLLIDTPTPVIQVTEAPIASPTPQIETPAATIVASPMPVATPVQRGSVVFRGTVRILSIQPVGSGPNQANEYVELYNEGPQQVDLNGWTLKAIRLSDGAVTDTYIFGNGAIIAAGQICRIYTNVLVAPDNCGFAGGFESSTPIWPDDGGAQASLFDPQNVEHARFTY